MKRLLIALIFTCMMAISYHASAATVTYFLDDIVQDNGTQLTGNFTWTYTEGDFENGSGVFNELLIPDDPHALNELSFSIQPASIEITSLLEQHNKGVDISLFLLEPFTATTGSALDLVRSKWSLRAGGISGVFSSGSITPTVVPIPAAIWLFGSGLIALLGFARRKV